MESNSDEEFYDALDNSHDDQGKDMHNLTISISSPTEPSMMPPKIPPEFPPRPPNLISVANSGYSGSVDSFNSVSDLEVSGPFSEHDKEGVDDGLAAGLKRRGSHPLAMLVAEENDTASNSDDRSIQSIESSYIH